MKKAYEILKRCEQELKVVLEETARSGQYDRLMVVGRWARNVAALAQEAQQSLPSDERLQEKPTSGQPKSGSALTTTGRQTAGSLSSGQPSGSRRSSARVASGTRPKEEYPKFARQEDQLVKIGWSRKLKEEYVHKAPVQVAQQLRDVLLNSKADSQTVATDQLLPLQDADGHKTPVYQAYVCLAWFKTLGVVQQEGRQGYRVPDRQKLADVLTGYWQSLSEV